MVRSSGKLWKTVKSFYVDTVESVSGQVYKLYIDACKWFPVNVGLRQGCVMYPWFFNVDMNVVV